MKKRKKRIYAFITGIILGLSILLAGIYHASQDRYELPFDAKAINYITLSRFPTEIRKDIRDKKGIQKIISSFHALRVYPWEETELVFGGENMWFIFHLTDGNEEESLMPLMQIIRVPYMTNQER